jgi:hypothetical protein
MRFVPKTRGEDGRVVSGSRGHNYLGARELPGVRELFEDFMLKPETDAKDDERRQRELRGEFECGLLLV